MRTTLLTLVFVFCLALTGCGSARLDFAPTSPDTACSNNDDCKGGEICHKNVCVPFCSAEEPCPNGKRCDLAVHVCTDLPAVDGDSDGDNGGDPDPDAPPSDGDGSDQPVDGDHPGDNDHPPSDGDGEEEFEPPSCEGGCPPHMHCNNSLGVCDYDPEHCHVTGCSPETICNPSSGVCDLNPEHCLVKGCPEKKYCDRQSGQCLDFPAGFPDYCKPCVAEADCAGGGVCYTDGEALESFCAPPCVLGNCPAGSECLSGYGVLPVCMPLYKTCGNRHRIGGTCTDNWQCVEGGFCIKESDNEFGTVWPRGYCSRVCTWGDDSTCGDSYTRCTRFSQTPSGTIDRCTRLCDNTLPCRTGYACQLIESVSLSICEPPPSGAPAP